MEHLFYNRWEDLASTLIVGVLGYVFLVGCLRWSGKRTLSKMNAFDLIVTVSLGSVLASLLLSKSVALAEGVVALSLLVAAVCRHLDQRAGALGAAPGDWRAIAADGARRFS